MRIRKTDCLDSKAEGRCVGYPYDTELASSAGVSIHFWMGDLDEKTAATEAEKALGVAMRDRDIVYARWSPGEPAGFWAHHDMN